MIRPTKHEDLNYNILVLGADIIGFLKKDELSIEELYQKMKFKKEITLDTLFDTLTFLWLMDAIDLGDNSITLLKATE